MEVHLGDENASKAAGAQIRCMMEARPNGQQPMPVSHHAATLEEAYSGAAGKLEHLLESRVGRLHHHKGAPSIRDYDHR